MNEERISGGQVYKQGLDEVLANYSVNPSNGLTDLEVATQFEKYGYNRLEEEKGESFLRKLIRQFQDFLVIILIVASIFSAVTGDYFEALLIIAIVVLNALLGVYQEGRAEKAVEALQKMASPTARLLRNGKQVQVPSEEVVPGDIVLLEAGDIVPADVRLIESSNLAAEEAALTGESVPVEKHAVDLGQEDLPLGDRQNMLYSSTAVTSGRGTAVVVGTGDVTEMGKIAGQLHSIEDEQTPLQKSIDQLGKMLGLVLLGVVIITFLVGLLRGGDVRDLLMTSISLAVAAVPEGLPAIVTIVLSLGMGRMAQQNSIVKRLLAVETLGSVDIICSDKTGTLTQNEMTVTRVYVGGETYEVSGVGYAPEGTITSSEGKVSEGAIPDNLSRLLTIASLCNEAELQENEGAWGILGDPTEASLLALARKAGFVRSDLQNKYPRIGDLPFDSSRKMMSVFHTDFSDGTLSLTKGAPDIILKRSSRELTPDGVVELTDARRQEILDVNNTYAQSALRVLSFAYSEHPDGDFETAEENLIFVGLVGMIDPARPEVRDAMALCHQAGIRAVMITGDYRETALAIARDLNMMKEGDLVFSGTELDGMSDEDLRAVVDQVAVFARVSPEHKLRIVNALRANGHITSMTGDGVNDAPALKQADIGVAMGITGTEVSKGAADMILTDDNFATIVTAVQEGRIIYANIRKFVNFLLSCNIGEVLVIFLSILILGPQMIPLVPIQLLWLNLVTDSFPALALGQEKGESDIMLQPPRRSDSRILNKDMIWSIATQAIAIFASVYIAFNFGLARYGTEAGLPHDGARTYAFVTLILAELLRAYSSRSEHESVFKIGLFSNKTMLKATAISFVLLILVIYIPFLDPVFHTIPLGILEWLLLIGLALIPFIVGELFKKIYYRS